MSSATKALKASADALSEVLKKTKKPAKEIIDLVPNPEIAAELGG